MTEQLLGALKSDETCVSTNESQLAGLSRAVCNPVIRAYIEGAWFFFWVASLDSNTSPVWPKRSNYVYSSAWQRKVSEYCPQAHCITLSQPFLALVTRHPPPATVNNIMYWEQTSCLYFPCKLHWRACWHCPLQLITVEIKSRGENKRKKLKWRRHERVMCMFLCVLLIVIQRCRGSIVCKNLSSSWQLIIRVHCSFYIIWGNGHKLPTPVSMICHAPFLVKLNQLLTYLWPSCPACTQVDYS